MVETFGLHRVTRFYTFLSQTTTYSSFLKVKKFVPKM